MEGFCGWEMKGKNAGWLLWFPTLAAMRLRQGWGTQFCGWGRESKNKGGAPGADLRSCLGILQSM